MADRSASETAAISYVRGRVTEALARTSLAMGASLASVSMRSPVGLPRLRRGRLGSSGGAAAVAAADSDLVGDAAGAGFAVGTGVVGTPFFRRGRSGSSSFDVLVPVSFGFSGG